MTQDFSTIIFQKKYSKDELKQSFAKISHRDSRDIFVCDDWAELYGEEKHLIIIQRNIYTKSNRFAMGLNIIIHDDSLYYDQDLKFYSKIIQEFQVPIYVDDFSGGAQMIQLIPFDTYNEEFE